MVMKHLDLFSGIGGFAYAADQVFGSVEHIFCDNEPFAQAVLKKHWPESYIYHDIRAITADTDSTRLQRENPTRSPGQPWAGEHIDLLTGGFPCQPFSTAGLRRGTADERHLWPEMLRVVRLTKPTWVIAENVRGLLTWNQGMVFEEVCTDLEASGYEVQPLIIPAVAVNAPHRRDRVWFVAHATDITGRRGTSKQNIGTPGEIQERNEMGEPTESDQIRNLANSTGYRWQWRRPSTKAQKGFRTQPEFSGQLPSGLERQNSWHRNWPEVAAELCSVDDGLPVELDGLKLTKAQHRAAQLKAYGNAIVPQVAMAIMEGIAI